MPRDEFLPPQAIDLSDDVLANAESKVHYAISQEQHAIQVSLALARGLPRLPLENPERTGPVAVVAYGPSLLKTWERLRAYPKIISMSGSHQFLVERGIVPTWHLESDPQPHKATFLKNPHKDTTFIVSSCCHPEVFEALRERRCLLVNQLQNIKDPLLPGTSMVGGSCVGLRALVLARILGFRLHHVFGMDCSFDERTHAGDHPRSATKRSRVRCGDSVYETSNPMLTYARQFFKTANLLADCQIVLHGKGLLQNMVYNKLKEPMPAADAMAFVRGKEAEVIALQPSKLLSDEYKALNRQLHDTVPSYGTSGARRAKVVLKLAKGLNTTSILDYGCGKGELARNLPFPIWEYDPGIPGKENAPLPADIVVCTDVLEHIEPDYLEKVLIHLVTLSRIVVFLAISVVKAQKNLPDGRNAHLIVESADWWAEKLSTLFHITQKVVSQHEVQFLMRKK